MSGNRALRADRIAADIDALAAITEPDRPWTRRSFTPLFLDGRTFLERAMRAAGLATRLDAAGNLVGRREGRAPGAAAIVVGSHSDTVPDGGRFDGIAGVVAGLEIARVLAERDIRLDHAFEVIDCLAEEVSVFGVSCVGSRAVAGALDAGLLARTAEGRSLDEAVTFVGGRPDLLAAARRDDVAAFLELHIEQGPVLEAEALDVGVVTAIAGITRVEIVVEGRADHAGTTPMTARADALAAGAELVLGIRRLACDRAAAGEGHFAATVGEFSIEPNAANVVPSRARLLIDARAERRPPMTAFLADLAALAAAVAAANGVAIGPPRVVSDNAPTPSDPRLVDALAAAADRVGARHRPMASGAGHDMAWFARIAPAAMVFVPCEGGRSHAPEERADPAAIALGAEVLLETVIAIDRSL